MFRFLKIIENEMNRTTNMIARGCVSSTNAVEKEKNTLLAMELEKLLTEHEHVFVSLIIVPQSRSSRRKREHRNSNRRKLRLTQTSRFQKTSMK